MRALAAAALAAVTVTGLAACGGRDSDEETLDALVAFAREPGEETWSRLPLADTVRLGLGDRLRERHSARELRDPEAWLVEARLFRAGVGPFSALAPLARTEELEYREGSYRRCAEAPAAPPAEISSLRRRSIHPRETESCLQWFAVDVFLTNEDEIAAVTLDYFEP
jgi:hypothetical protein